MLREATVIPVCFHEYTEINLKHVSMEKVWFGTQRSSAANAVLLPHVSYWLVNSTFLRCLRFLIYKMGPILISFQVYHQEDEMSIENTTSTVLGA